MKMTKIESARIIVKNEGACNTVSCKHCFMGDGVCGFVSSRPEKIKFAEAYIKRHESKSKKKDHILDTAKKVEEPKPIKTVGIDNSDVTLALTAQHEPTPLQIAKMIRDNGYSCTDFNKEDGCFNRKCPLFLGSNPCGLSHNLKTASEENKALRKKLIDDYISANEPVKDCPANSEIPQPIKLPDFVYSASKNGVGFIDTKNRTFNTNDKGELLINDKPCFATPEEALQFAKKLWNGEGK